MPTGHSLLLAPEASGLSPHSLYMMHVPFRKRLFDLALTIPALLLLAPVLQVVALLVRFKLGSPILFRQQRPGFLGRPFTVFKFRTMTDARDTDGNLLPDRERLTLPGRFLRKASLDELPQLWNVIRGDMSLVGPRPLLMAYLPNYTPEQARRHDVLPGITGWAQINGRNGVAFGDRLKLDVWYVDHWSLWLDIKIIARTVGCVLRSSGVKLEQPLDEMDDIGLHPETRRKAALAGKGNPAAGELQHNATSRITILITGVGGPLGQALIKAARQSSIPLRILGTDRSELSAGLAWVDRSFVIPGTAQPGAYRSAMRGICAAESPRLILPGSESELELLSNNARALRDECGAVVVASPPAVLGVGLDKWATCCFLQKAGLNFPRSARLEDSGEATRLVGEFGFPLIAKPCRGSGSRNLFKVWSWKDIDYIRSLDGRMILQEYLQPDDEEYTVAVYTCQDGRQAGSISFRRELVAGNTYRAWVAQNPVVQKEAGAVVAALRPAGPCNVQLRLTARGPVVFEINPRFSGSTAMRAHFGYNEVEMAVRDLALNQAVPIPTIREGTALRFWDETYLDTPASQVRSAGDCEATPIEATHRETHANPRH